MSPRSPSATKRGKRAIAAFYSWAADRFYDDVIAGVAIPFFGGRINHLIGEHQVKAVGSSDGEPILDMPVGTAIFTVDMARQHSGLVVGCDIATGMVEHSRRVALERGVTNLVVVQADAHHLPFKDGAFAAVVSSNGLQVIPGLEPTLSELTRVVAEKGSLYIAAISLPLPVGGTRTRARIPGLFRNPSDVARLLANRGFRFTLRRHRLGYAIEASKREVSRAHRNPARSP